MTVFQHADPAHLPGAVFAAETREDGPLIASVGKGWSAGTICEIGTMTKAFTATAVLLALEEHDLLNLELEAWRLPGMEVYATDASKRRIRVRHLLQHTSGLPTIQPYTASPKTPCNDPDRPWRPCPSASMELGPTVPWDLSTGRHKRIYPGRRAVQACPAANPRAGQPVYHADVRAVGCPWQPVFL